MYDTCDSQLQTGKLLKGKGHSFRNVKGLVSIAVPEGCKVTLYTEAIRGKALGNSTNLAMSDRIKGSKRVCVSILNKPVVLVGMEDDGDLGEIVGSLRATIQRTKKYLNRNCVVCESAITTDAVTVQTKEEKSTDDVHVIILLS